MTVWIGTSGWQYAHWRGVFYPAGLPTRSWLPFYAGSFDTVEVNNAFYRLPDAEVFERWRTATPEGFDFAVKASSFLTHRKRLKDPQEPVDRLMARASALGEKLGPVLLQLPPSMRVDADRLEETLSCFGSSVRVAVETRHESWDCEAVWSVLAAHDAAWCIADATWRRWPLVRTATWGYVRLHEGRGTPRPCYGRVALERWVERIAELWPGGEDVYVYFNNDPQGCALRDAQRLAAGARRMGLVTTRVPGRGVVRLSPPG